MFAPLLGVVILTPPKAARSSEPGWVFRTYRAFLTWAMRAKWLTIAVTLALFAASLFAVRLIPSQFFPASDRPELLVDMTLPQNASIFASETVARRLDEVLEDDPDVARWSTNVGRGAIRFYLPFNVQLPNNFFSQAVVVAKDVRARDRLQQKLKKFWPTNSRTSSPASPHLNSARPSDGRSSTASAAPRSAQVRDIALKLAQTVAKNQQVVHVNFDWFEPARRVRIQIDQNEARLLGLSSQALASVLNTVISGSAITQVRDDIYLVDVITRATDEERVSLDTLRSVQVPLANGRTVPLSQFASFTYDQEQPLIWRRDRLPTLTVQADVSQGVLPATVVDALAPSIAELNKTFPRPYRIAVGGVVEDSAKAQASVVAVVPAMLLIMFTVLMVQLRSFSRLFIVLSVGPLGLIGVVGALLLSGKPLGFVAILGILALLGMITKNAVILIGQIEAERSHGKDIWQATVDASSTRFRPIMLTAISTVLGMIPIAPTVFWGPMAFAIMGGLLVGTILTLIFLPTLYVAWFGGKEVRSDAKLATVT